MAVALQNYVANTMSATNAELEAGEMMCCACCGVAGGDDVKLRNCTACYLVKYCGIECQRKHRPQHKRACKKRAAELKDELLFKQPESTNRGDCPICLLPIPIVVKSTIYQCCSKVVCHGCVHTNDLRGKEARLPPACPFCRHTMPKTKEEGRLLIMKRVKANDPVALDDEGMDRYHEGDYATAIEYWEKAAGLGNIESHYHLSTLYLEGRGVKKDRKKYIIHTEQAAIGGHVIARYNLGVEEERKGNRERAVKHFIIAANLGNDLSLQALKNCYKYGVVSKDVFAAALRAHQAALDATKSPQRDAAEAAGILHRGEFRSLQIRN